MIITHFHFSNSLVYGKTWEKLVNQYRTRRKELGGEEIKKKDGANKTSFMKYN
jgi:hypothetical protein